MHQVTKISIFFIENVATRPPLDASLNAKKPSAIFCVLASKFAKVLLQSLKYVKGLKSKTSLPPELKVGKNLFPSLL